MILIVEASSRSRGTWIVSMYDIINNSKNYMISIFLRTTCYFLDAFFADLTSEEPIVR